MKNKKLLSFAAIGLSVALLITGTMAYFTDVNIIKKTGTAGAIDLNLSSAYDESNTSDESVLYPGEIRDASFSVMNKGNKSLDYKTVITLTSPVSMSDNYYNPETGVNSLSLKEQPELYAGSPYSSEFELYWRDDVVYTEGEGYSPVEGAEPVQTRAINSAGTKIVYTINSTVLSGDEDLSEREIEWKPNSLISDYYLIEKKGLSKDYICEYDDFSSLIDGIGPCSKLMLNFYGIKNNVIVIPEKIYTISDNYEEMERTVDYIDLSTLVGVENDNSNTLYVSSNVKGFLCFEDDHDYDYVLTEKEAENLFGINIEYYNNLEDIINTYKSIPNSEYEKLSDSEKANYSQYSDEKFYDLVLLFDANSGSGFQSVPYSLTIDVYAKQHRNTEEVGWQIVEGTNAADEINRNSSYNVEMDNLNRVVLKSTKENYDESTMTEITIPEGVQVIPNKWFYNNDTLETINLPSTIEEIGKGAFAGCTSLKNVNIPNDAKLEYVGKRAFEGCSSLTTISLSDNLLVIDDNAFAYCNNLTTVNLPDNLMYIKDYAFIECTSLSNISLPNNLEYLGTWSFVSCNKLKTITIPASLTSVGSEPFLYSGLESVEFEDGCKTVFALMFSDCGHLTSVVLPETISTIDYQSFKDCISLTSLTIPSSVSFINESSFVLCDNLKITINPNNRYYSADDTGVFIYDKLTGFSWNIVEGY